MTSATSLFGLSTVKNPYYETSGLNKEAIWGRFIPISSYATLNTDSFPNLNPKNGWQVISYNFGKDYLGNTHTSTNDMKDPYFILYNKYTGQLRVLFTIENNGGYQDRVNTYLGFPQTSNNTGGIGGMPTGNILGSGLFSMYKDPIQTLDEISNPNIMVPAPANGGTQWSVADYTLQYDPCVCNNNSQLKIEFNNYTTQKIELSGRGVGITSPFGTNGKNPTRFGEDFMLQVTEGFNSDGSFMFNSSNELAKSLYVPPMNWLEKLVKNGLNTAFNKATGGLLGLGGNFLSSAMSSEITPWLNKAVKNNQDFAWAIGKLGIKGDTTGGVTQYSSKDVAGALAGYLGTATSGFSMNLFDTKEPGPTNFFLNEFEFKAVGTSSGLKPAQRNEIDILNPGSLNTKTVTPVKHYPLYNEPLGLFAMLRKPKIKRRANYLKHESPKRHALDQGDARPDNCDPIDAVDVWFTGVSKTNKLDYELGGDIQFVLNPSAEIDLEKTQISAAWKIPIIYKKSCGYGCDMKVDQVCGDYFIWNPYNGIQMCNFLKDTFDLSISGKYIKISNDNDSLNTDTAYYSTPYIPLEHFKNLRFSHSFGQRVCSEFTDVPSGIRLSLMIHYVYKPNAYGEVNEHFQTLDFGVDVETTENFTKPVYTLPTSGTITIGNTIYTKDTTIYADSIVLNGNISTINGATVRIISKKPINQIGGIIGANISYYQGTIYPANTIIPYNADSVKLFCSSSNYKAKAYPYSNKMVSNSGPYPSKFDQPFAFSLHPNPASSVAKLTLTNYQNTNANIKIFDLMGREMLEVIEKDITNREHNVNLDIERLAPGTYIVKVNNGFDEKVTKLVVVRY
jgi:hypothetical protein